MKTTLDLPDELLAEAKTAAKGGRFATFDRRVDPKSVKNGEAALRLLSDE